ncbi:MAG TPA: TIGR03086 family metal-binding protein, partial [Acidimicrobiales bacterium]|nr:TIGR03086 family metal-binding protein [Acidimicrobiales bacterium]
MGATAPLEQAIAVANRVLGGVAKEDMDKPTPCASWNVGQLVNHLVGANYFFVSMLGGEVPGGGGVDFAAGDYQGAFAEASAASVAKFGEPGAFDKTINLPWGAVPGSAFFGLATTDIFQHSWDLAKATGQSTDLDGDLAAQLLEGAKAAISDAFRGPDGGPMQDQGPPFGAEQSAPAGA